MTNEIDLNTVRSMFLETAASQIETNQYNWEGKQRIQEYHLINGIDYYPSHTGEPPAWCASFAWWCFVKSCEEYNKLQSAFESDSAILVHGVKLPLIDIDKLQQYKSACALTIFNNCKVVCEVEEKDVYSGCCAIWKHINGGGHIGVIINAHNATYEGIAHDELNPHMPNGQPAIETIEGNTSPNDKSLEHTGMTERDGGYCQQKRRYLLKMDTTLHYKDFELVGYIDLFKLI